MSQHAPADGRGDESPLHYTPTETRILDVLSDGMGHTIAELMPCLDDDLAGVTALRFHVSNIRKKLQRVAQDILCVTLGRGQKYYRWVRLLDSNPHH